MFQALASRVLPLQTKALPGNYAAVASLEGGTGLNEILILEDDVANLKGLSGLLRSEEYSVLEASNGFQAIEKAKTFGPISLFISDMELPRFSGTQIALMLISLYPNMPVGSEPY
jgi:PleD family two-component response regulator